MKVCLLKAAQRGIWALTLAGPLVGGCANMVDTVSSQRFKKAPFHTTFQGDEAPIEVLRHSEEGDRRGKAMLALKEPKRNGGTDAEQEEVMQILSASATTDQRLICRLDAAESAGPIRGPSLHGHLADSLSQCDSRGSSRFFEF